MPQLDAALVEATKAVPDPRTRRSVYDVWRAFEGRAPVVGRIGSGSDYAAFLDHVGVPSLDAGFTAPASPFTYHTAYDDTGNLERRLDPGYLGQLGSARVAGVVALRLANAEVLPLRPSDYAAAVSRYLPRRAAGRRARAAAARGAVMAPGGARARGARSPAAAPLAGNRSAIARVNRALMRQERALTARSGLPGRPWYRHMVYAPGVTTGYEVEYLPGLRGGLLGALQPR